MLPHTNCIRILKLYEDTIKNVLVALVLSFYILVCLIFPGFNSIP